MPNSQLLLPDARVHATLDELAAPVDARYFRADAKVPYDPSRYVVRGARSSNPDTLPRGRLIFKPDVTHYGLVLVVESDDVSRHGNIDAAVLGFNLVEVGKKLVLEVDQIQGTPDSYKELTPVMWDKVLLARAIEFASAHCLGAVHVIPGHAFEGKDDRDVERLNRRYDRNAWAHGGNYDSILDRYVIDLTKSGNPNSN